MPLLVFPGGYVGGMVHTPMETASASRAAFAGDVWSGTGAERPGQARPTPPLCTFCKNCGGFCVATRRMRAHLAWGGTPAGPIRPSESAAGSRAGFFSWQRRRRRCASHRAEGISMAMQSAWLLCRRLIGAPKREGARPPCCDRETLHSRIGTILRTAYTRRSSIRAYRDAANHFPWALCADPGQSLFQDSDLGRTAQRESKTAGTCA